MVPAVTQRATSEMIYRPPDTLLLDIGSIHNVYYNRELSIRCTRSAKSERNDVAVRSLLVKYFEHKLTERCCFILMKSRPIFSIN